jgi:holo-[acyl-carrier protein] synthase
MIHGIGVDIVTVSRVEKVYQRFGDRFVKRFLHPQEITQLANRTHAVPFLAKRFAVKEAAVKALGTGERNGVLLRDFYVLHDELGKPLLQVSGEAKKRSEKLGISAMHVSLSDEGDKVVAFVILEISP